MYAIFRSGGKQYRVKAGDTVKVEKMEKELGAEFTLDEVLLVGGEDKTFVGAPLVKDAKVTVVVTQQDRAAKIVVFKKKRRQGYRRTQGHRQQFTELFVKEIASPEGGSSVTDKKAQVIDPAKKVARQAERKEKLAAEKADSKKNGKKAATKAKTPKKTATKKKTVTKKK